MVESDVAIRKDNVIEEGHSTERHSPGTLNFSIAAEHIRTDIMAPAIAIEDIPRSMATASLPDEPCTSSQPRSNAMVCEKSAYTGLVNQAMTCYLNSLIQTLYMTPEFRNAVYNWEFHSYKGDEGKSIPYQLQKLFLLLQTSDKAALETKDLTKSFGWDSSHAWDQHDVQELCRVMFDALEHTWRKSSRALIINNFYQGTIRDYVKCLECQTESARDDVFLDLPLAVRPFGSQQSFCSVIEALNAFVKAELIEGSNQYSCSHCSKKCNAHKGLKITRFPYLLTMQLKRFDFDYATLHRIKLNDRMTFPDVLNLNPFIEKPVAELGCIDESAENQPDNDDGAFRLQNVAAPKPVNAQRSDSDDEGIGLDNNGAPSVESSTHSPVESEPTYDYDVNLVNDKIDPNVVKMYLNEGPYVYELFSIMVHSGSANGGHYYAYIKHLDSKIWYCFNDQVVNRASVEDIRKTYGGSNPHFGSYTYSSSTNAYMLMYRKIQPSINEKFITNDQLPSHLINMLERLSIEEIEQRREEEYQRSLTTLVIYCYQPETNELLKEEIQIPKKESVQTLIDKCYKQFQLDKFNINVDQTRLVKLNPKCTIDGCIADDWSACLKNSVQNIIGYSLNDYLLEIRPGHMSSFRHYTTYGITFHIRTVTIDADGACQIASYFPFYVESTCSVGQLKASLSEFKQWSDQQVHLLIDRYTDRLRVLDVADRVVRDEVGGQMSPVVLYTAVLPLDAGADALKAAHGVVERHKNAVQFRLLLPTERECREHFFGASGMASADVDSMDGYQDESPEHAISAYEQFVHFKKTDDMGKCSPPAPPPPPPPYSPPYGGASMNRRRPCVVEGGDGSSPQLCWLASPISADVNAATSSNDADDASMGAATPSPRVSPTAAVDGDDDSRPASMCNVDSPVHNADPSLATLTKFSNASDWLFNNMPFQSGSGDPNFGGGGDDAISSPVKQCCDSPSLPVVVHDGRYETSDGRVAPSNSPTSVPPSDPPIAAFNINRECTFTVCEESETQRVCTVECDGRMMVTDFKIKLADYIGAKPDQFKLLKLYSNNSEYPWTYQNDQMKEINNSYAVRVKLGRVLKENESLIKFHLFDHCDYQNNKYLFDYVISKTTSLPKMKNRIRDLLIRKCDIKTDVNKIRIRDVANNRVDWVKTTDALHSKSSWANTDLHIQILADVDPTDLDYSLLFVRRWIPSTATFGSVDEILLPPECTYEQLFQKIGALCHLDVKSIEVASTNSDGFGSYPFECGKLKMLEDVSFHELPNDDDWRQKSIDNSPLHASCGQLVYYRDKHEKTKSFGEDERKEMQIKDSVKFRKMSSFTFRKERALKIYTEISSSIKEDDDQMDNM